MGHHVADHAERLSGVSMLQQLENVFNTADGSLGVRDSEA